MVFIDSYQTGNGQREKGGKVCSIDIKVVIGTQDGHIEYYGSYRPLFTFGLAARLLFSLCQLNMDCNAELKFSSVTILYVNF